MATMNCGECLVNHVKVVKLVDMVCPDCSADYREVRDFTVVAVIPSPQRNSAPKLASVPAEPDASLQMPVIFEEKVTKAIRRLRAVALDAEYQGSSGQSLAWRIESIVNDLESKKLTREDEVRLFDADKLADELADHGVDCADGDTAKLASEPGTVGTAA